MANLTNEMSFNINNSNQSITVSKSNNFKIQQAPGRFLKKDIKLAVDTEGDMSSTIAVKKSRRPYRPRKPNLSFRFLRKSPANLSSQNSSENLSTQKSPENINDKKSTPIRSYSGVVKTPIIQKRVLINQVPIVPTQLPINQFQTKTNHGSSSNSPLRITDDQQDVRVDEIIRFSTVKNNCYDLEKRNDKILDLVKKLNEYCSWFDNDIKFIIYSPVLSPSEDCLILKHWENYYYQLRSQKIELEKQWWGMFNRYRELSGQQNLTFSKIPSDTLIFFNHTFNNYVDQISHIKIQVQNLYNRLMLSGKCSDLLINLNRTDNRRNFTYNENPRSIQNYDEAILILQQQVAYWAARLILLESLND